MLNEKTRDLQVVTIDQIDLSKSFVVWSELGQGTQHRLLEKFCEPEYHVCILRSNILEFIDFMALPVLNKDPALPVWINELKKVREEGTKKIVLIFDEINIASSAAVKAFEESVTTRTLSGINFAPTDIIMAKGVMDGSGGCRETPVDESVMDMVNHYTLKPYI